MREGQFIKKNIERWKSYQEEPATDPDEVARRFAHLVDDLAYAKTFYPFSNTVRYINGLAADIYLSIYRNKKEKSSRFVRFWTTELPLILYRYRFILLCSFLLFLVFTLLGILASAMEPDFIRSVMGSDYVDTTEQNIASGDPFGIYKNGDSLSMFLMIAFHNVRLSLLSFGSGIFFGIGTVFFLFQNGIMFGAFEHMFYQHHLGTQFFLVVFIHGTLELSALVIESCAGMILGSALLFPGTYTRMQSLQKAARDAVKIIIGLIPVFVIAAFFESYVTRHTGMPLWMSISILAGSMAFILWYFVVYPALVHRKCLLKPLELPA